MKITRSNEMPWADALKRGRYENRRKALGGDKLSAGLWELLPGKRSFPMHAHLVTEEALFVVSGRGKVNTPEGAHDIGPGDYVSFPPGGTAHQLENDGTEPLVYVGLSAGQGVDVVQYPATGKLAAAVGSGPTAKRWIFRDKDQVDYFDGEE